MVLADAMADADEATRRALVALAGGSPGRAVQLGVSDVAGLQAALDGIATATAGEAGALALDLAKSLATKTAQSRYEAMLELAPAYLATAARSLTGTRLARAIALWEKANALASAALPLSLEPQSVAFALAELVGGLAPSHRNHTVTYEIA